MLRSRVLHLPYKFKRFWPNVPVLLIMLLIVARDDAINMHCEENEHIAWSRKFPTHWLPGHQDVPNIIRRQEYESLLNTRNVKILPDMMEVWLQCGDACCSPCRSSEIKGILTQSARARLSAIC